MLSGVIAGLGRIGFSFNLDPKRRDTWTHERAFALSGKVRLVAASDPFAQARRRFSAARPEVPVYSSLGETLRRHRPQIVSICTPTGTHPELARACSRAGVPAIFCEKPLAATSAQALAILRDCQRSGAVLAVNHTRRWDPVYRRAAGLVRRGAIGKVLSISARYSGHIYNVGTHLIDAIRMVTGLDPAEASGLSADPTAADPHVSGFLLLGDGVFCAISCHGRPSDLLFELDLVGSEGRLRIVENGQRTLLEKFRSSRRYSGYREPAPAKLAGFRRSDRFVEAVRDISLCLDGGGRRPSCTGEDGFWAVAAAEALVKSARSGGRSRPVASPDIRA